MKKKLWITTLMVLALVGVMSVGAAGTTLTVDGDGSAPDTYATIQAAVDAATEGDTVIVNDGTYDVSTLLADKSNLSSAHYLLIDKSITLKAENKGQVTLTATAITNTSGVVQKNGTQQQTVYIAASDVVFDGFVVNEITGYSNKTVEIIAPTSGTDVTNVTIQNCTINGNCPIYIGSPDVGQYTVKDNVLNGPVAITNGAGNGTDGDKSSITGNTLTRLSLTGTANTAWTLYELNNLPTITGNTFKGETASYNGWEYQAFIYNSSKDTTKLLTNEKLTEIATSNTLPCDFIIEDRTTGDAEDPINTWPYYTNYKMLISEKTADFYNGDTGVAYDDLADAIAEASKDDTIYVAKDVTEVVTITNSDITLQAAKSGVTLEKGVTFYGKNADDVVNYENITIDGFTIPVGLAVNGAGYSVSNLTISNNIITGQLLLADANGNDANPQPCVSATIINNVVTATKADGVIKARDLSNVTISGNTVYADVFNATGIMVWYCGDAQITGNTIVTAQFAGINVTDTAGSVMGNTIKAYGTQEGTQYALIFSNVTDVVVKNNNIAYIEGEGGVIAQDGSYVDVTGNTWNTETPVTFVSDGSGDQDGIDYGAKSTLIIEADTTQSTESQLVENMVGSLSDTSSTETVNTVASAVLDVVASVEDAHTDTAIVDAINNLDTLFVAANDNITSTATTPTVTTTTAIDATKEVEVSGLALSAFGGTTVTEAVAVSIAVTEKTVEDLSDAMQETVTENTIILEIKPQVTVSGSTSVIDNADLQTPVSFTIYLTDDFAGTHADVVHIKSDNSTETMRLEVKTDADGHKYITITVTEFSSFLVTPYTYPSTPDSSTSGNYTATYTSSVAATTNGSVSLSSVRSALNATVTITATPDDGYAVDTVSVAYGSGREVSVTQNTNGTYSYKQPGAAVTVTVTFVFTGAVEEEVEEEIDALFSDVDVDAYYYDAVLWAVENGITAGYSDGTFQPTTVCTRAQAVTFLWRAAGEPTATIDNPFSDLVEGAYYYDAVLWAVENGITAGYEDGTFQPNTTCNRGAIVTFLYRAAGEPSVSGEAKEIASDVTDGTYYYNAVLWAVENGITTGYSDGTFQPNTTCNRGAIVTFLYRYMG